MSKKKPDAHASLPPVILSTRRRDKADHIAAWFSRIIRWAFGTIFIVGGIYYYDRGGWPAILFGFAFLVTGCFRPGRCLQGDTYTVKENERL